MKSRSAYSLDWLLLLPCILAAVYLGKDVNWDFLNYHLYAGYSALHDRFGLDFLPASIQSYLVPYAYVPIYGLVILDFPSNFICAVLGAIHGINAVLVLRIARRLLPSAVEGGIQFYYLAASVFLGLFFPLFLLELGTSFIDIATAIFILLAFYVLLEGVPVWRSRTLLIAGAAIGIAVALKLTNAVFAVAALASVAMIARRRILACVAYCVGAGIGLFSVAGYWFYKTWLEFGNPVFPLFNGFFRSPDFLPVSHHHFRFLPESLVDALKRVFEIALPIRQVYVESSEPDVRPAAMLIAALVLGVCLTYRRGKKEGTIAREAESWRTQRLVFALCFWLTALTVWLFMSANGRYFIAGLILTGPIFVATLWKVGEYAGSTRLFVYGTLAILGVQLFQTTQASDLRWSGGQDESHWITVSMPDEIKNTPYTVISTSALSHSFLVPYLHPDSVFINVFGQYSIGPGKPGFDRAMAKISDPSRGVIVLNPLDATRSDNKPALPSSLSSLQRAVGRFGLAIESNRCGIIRSNEVLSHRYWQGSKPDVDNRRDHYDGYMQYCHAHIDVSVDREQAPWEVERAFDQLETACPSLFSPARQATVPSGTGWIRTYVDSDVSLYTVGDNIFRIGWRQGEPIVTGLVSAWSQSAQTIDCREKFDPVEFPGIPFVGKR